MWYEEECRFWKCNHVSSAVFYHQCEADETTRCICVDGCVWELSRHVAFLPDFVEHQTQILLSIQRPFPITPILSELSKLWYYFLPFPPNRSYGLPLGLAHGGKARPNLSIPVPAPSIGLAGNWFFICICWRDGCIDLHYHLIAPVNVTMFKGCEFLAVKGHVVFLVSSHDTSQSVGWAHRGGCMWCLLWWLSKFCYVWDFRVTPSKGAQFSLLTWYSHEYFQLRTIRVCISTCYVPHMLPHIQKVNCRNELNS